MAAPAVAVAALIGNGIGGLAAYFAAQFTAKTALSAAMLIFFVAGVIALQAGMYVIWLGVGYVVPPSLYQAMSIVKYMLPSNAVTCFNALITARILAWVWRQQVTMVRFDPVRP